MKDQMNVDRLGELFAEIEQAWLGHKDRTVVYRLSEQHPELRELLYEFFEDLVLGPEEWPNSAHFLKAEDRVQQWLESTGVDIALQSASQTGTRSTTNADSTGLASPSGANTDHLDFDVDNKNRQTGEQPSEVKSPGQSHTTNLILFLRDRTKLKIPLIAASLKNVTTEYLILISRHPNIVPPLVKRTIATNIEQVWGISLNESIRYLNIEPSIVRAASRSRPFSPEPHTFEELLDRSELNQEQRLYWVHLKQWPHR